MATSSRSPSKPSAADRSLDVRDARRSFWLLMRTSAWMAVGAHTLFLALFAYIGAWPLAAVNVASIALYLACVRLLRKRRNRLVASLIVCEVLVHAAVAVVVIGGDSGFHYYLLAIVAPLVIGITGSDGNKLMRVSALGIFYIALDAYAHAMPPLHAIDRQTLAVLRYFNIGSTLAIMALLSLNYYRLVTDGERALRALATTDPLTGLHNRRRLLELARHELTLHARAPRPMCVLLCDVDHFKRVNDNHGHEVGDHALQALSRVLMAAVRQQDAVARWGGEEFLVLLCDATMPVALHAAERIRQAVAKTRIDERSLTITIGVAKYRAGEPLDGLIARADRALYRGKAQGRNQVEPEERAY